MRRVFPFVAGVARQTVGFHGQRLFMAGNGIIKGGNLAFQRIELFASLFRDGPGMAVQKVAVLAGLGRALLAQFLNAAHAKIS